MTTEKKFTKEDEWLSVDGDVVTVGITDYATEQLGDLVFVSLPKVGQQLKRGGEAAVVESVKAASDVYSPVTGEVLEINGSIVTEPGKVNADPFGEGWFFKAHLQEPSEVADLMDEAKYKEYAKR